jgi:hypothetical protein
MHRRQRPIYLEPVRAGRVDYRSSRDAPFPPVLVPLDTQKESRRGYGGVLLLGLLFPAGVNFARAGPALRGTVPNVSAEDAALILGRQHSIVASLAHVDYPAGLDRHDLRRLMTALRTGDH